MQAFSRSSGRPTHDAAGALITFFLTGNQQPELIQEIVLDQSSKHTCASGDHHVLGNMFSSETYYDGVHPSD